MNVNPVTQQEFQNLITQINGASSFTERLYITLNWSGNNLQRTAITGVSWLNDTSFLIKAEQLAPLFNVKPDTIKSSLRNNFFIKQFSPLTNGQRYVWSKPGFSIHGYQSKDQTKNKSSMSTMDSQTSRQFESSQSSYASMPEYPQSNHISSSLIMKHSEENKEKRPLKTGNSEFDEISSLIFTNSDFLNRSELIEQFHKKLCPCYIDKLSVERVFNDHFSMNNFKKDVKDDSDDDLLISLEEFWLFYQHFGPLNSILAKYHLYKNFSSNEQIFLGEKNKFLVKNKILICNDFKINAGKLFLKGENNQSFDSWEKIVQANMGSGNLNSSLKLKNYPIQS